MVRRRPKSNYELGLAAEKHAQAMAERSFSNCAYAAKVPFDCGRVKKKAPAEGGFRRAGYGVVPDKDKTVA